MTDAQLDAVDRLLTSFRQARLTSMNTPYRDVVMNDVRRSAASARDALRADGSPHASLIQEFLDATAREDSLARAKVIAGSAMDLANTAGKLAGIGSLAHLKWVVVVAAGLVGGLCGFLAIANLTAALVAAIPIGLIVARGPLIVSETSKSFGNYVSTPDAGRELVNLVVIPAEQAFFKVVPGKPVLVRTTTASATSEKAIASAALAALAIGAVLGVIAGLGKA